MALSLENEEHGSSSSTENSPSGRTTAPSFTGGVGYDVGSVLWHSSEEDGGPDVGIQVGLGRGFALYVGEMPTSTLREHGVDLDVYPDGWWAVLYGPDERWIIGAVPDHYRVQEAIEHIAGIVQGLAAGDSHVLDTVARAWGLLWAVTADGQTRQGANIQKARRALRGLLIPESQRGGIAMLADDEKPQPEDSIHVV